MENNHRFFANKECQYYPCHDDVKDINCLFCYCPLYGLRDCPGKPEFIERDGKVIKKCTGCSFPHLPENYDKVLATIKANR